MIAAKPAEVARPAKSREEIASTKGGKVVCGVIKIPGEACNTTNMLANLDEINRIAAAIRAKREGR